MNAEEVAGEVGEKKCLIKLLSDFVSLDIIAVLILSSSLLFYLALYGMLINNAEMNLRND